MSNLFYFSIGLTVYQNILWGSVPDTAVKTIKLIDG
jgi:hypothetical protein